MKQIQRAFPDFHVNWGGGGGGGGLVDHHLCSDFSISHSLQNRTLFGPALHGV